MIRIGVSIPLTGEHQTICNVGQDIIDVLNFAISKNSKEIELVIEDEKSSTEGIQEAASKLCDQEIIGVIGGPISGHLASAAEIYNEKKVVIISPMASAPSLKECGPYIVRSRPSEEHGSIILARYISERHTTVGLLSDNTEYGSGCVDSLRQYLTINPSTEINPDLEACFVATQTEEGLLEKIRTLREDNSKIQIYGSTMPGTARFLQIAGDESEGIEYVSFPNPEEILTEEGKELFKEFSSQFQIRTDHHVFFTTWEALNTLLSIEGSPDSLIEKIYEERFSGIIGEYSYLDTGEISLPRHVIKVIKAGRPEVLSS